MSRPWAVDDVPDQRGRTAVVTGANTGLGYATAEGLLRRGARVVLACRNRDKAEVAADRLRRHAPRGRVEVGIVDLGDLASVDELSDELLGRERLDLLVNNAGLMAVPASRTVDGFETQLGVNHLGHAALTLRLLPRLLDTPGSRVVTVTSLGHRRGRIRFDDLHARDGYDPWTAYFQSKLANVLFTLELQRRLARTGARTASLAAHPGGSATELGTEENPLVGRLVPLLRGVLASPADGALPTLRAATDPGALGGQLYGPRWRVSGPPVQELPSVAARDATTAARLWQATLDLTGVADPLA